MNTEIINTYNLDKDLENFEGDLQSGYVDDSFIDEVNEINFND